MLSTFIVAGSSGGLINALVFLLVVGIVLGILWYIIGIAPFLPAVFKQVLQWLVILFGALIVINCLMGLMGHALVAY